jgi:hypothetical protein
MSRTAKDDIPSISIDRFATAIERLHPDADYARRTGWVANTREQWLGWLSGYDGPGAYNRKGSGYDAKFAYNHVQNHLMLLWLVGAAGLEKPKLARAAAAAEQVKTMAQKAAAVRRIVPWSRAVELLWPTGV